MASSDWLERVRRKHIIDPVVKDPRETGVPETRFGLTIKWLFREAIGGGQASFDLPVAKLSPDDRVLLYAFLNQKGHVGELVHAFGKLLAEPHVLRDATVLDIGCGPFTAGLALAEVAGNEVPFRYFGVDTSKRMCAFGTTLANAAKAEGGLSSAVEVKFEHSTDDVDFGKQRSTQTLVVLSYLLASRSINVEVLVRQIVSACKRIGPGPVALLYTNSSRPEATAAYPAFEHEMVAAGFKVEVEDKETLLIEGRERKLHYALFVRPHPGEMSLDEFET
jgi:SAM-dependent methyltransferase